MSNTDDKWQNFLQHIPEQQRKTFTDYEIDERHRLIIYLKPGSNQEWIENRLGEDIAIAVKIAFGDCQYVLEVDTPGYEPAFKVDIGGQAYFDQMMFSDKRSDDSISYKRAYVDISGDVISAIILTDLCYWHRPNKRNKRRFNAYSKDGTGWVARTLAEWSKKTRLTPRQIQYAVDKLVKRDLVKRQNFRYKGLKTMHLRINEEVFGQRMLGIDLGIT